MELCFSEVYSFVNGHCTCYEGTCSHYTWVVFASFLCDGRKGEFWCFILIFFLGNSVILRLHLFNIVKVKN